MNIMHDFTDRFALISNQHLFMFTQDKKGLFKVCKGLSVRVWLFRISGCYPHEMWSEHSLSSLSLIILIYAQKSPHYSLSMEYRIPHILLHFHNFISSFFILFLFFSFFFVWKPSIFLKTMGQKGLLCSSWSNFSFHHTPNIGFWPKLAMNKDQKSWGLRVMDQERS